MHHTFAENEEINYSGFLFFPKKTFFFLTYLSKPELKRICCLILKIVPLKNFENNLSLNLMKSIPSYTDKLIMFCGR